MVGSFVWFVPVLFVFVFLPHTILYPRFCLPLKFGNFHIVFPCLFFALMLICFRSSFKFRIALLQYVHFCVSSGFLVCQICVLRICVFFIAFGLLKCLFLFYIVCFDIPSSFPLFVLRIPGPPPIHFVLLL